MFVEERDFAAVQKRTGNSALVTIPGFCIDVHTNTIAQMIGEVMARVYMEFGFEAKGKPVMLSGKYYPSIGFSPETVYSLVVEVHLSAKRPHNAPTHLRAAALKGLLQNQHLIQNAHILTGLFRLLHALADIK